MGGWGDKRHDDDHSGQHHMNGDGEIATTRDELLHAAITVGRRSWRDVLAHGRYSVFEICYRAAMLLANLEQSQGQLRKSSAYRHLDPSEKAAASYFIGLTSASLMARQCLGIHWLMHLDVYHDLLQPGLSASGRPDLVGLDAGSQWHVIEAKGRSNGLDTRVVAKAKEQTRKLRTVCGQAPILRVASVAHFSRETLALCVEDPVGRDTDAVDWDLTENQFLRDYYDPFVALIDQTHDMGAKHRVGAGELDITARSETVNGVDYLVVKLSDVDLAIGLNQRIYEIHRSADAVHDAIHRVLDLASPIVSRDIEPIDRTPTTRGDSDSVFVGSDGIFVRAGRTWFDDGW